MPLSVLTTANPINILIVDDNVDNLSVLKEALERPGVNIITTDLPTDAIKIAIQNDISIALVDVKMPVMSGFDVLNALKKDPSTENIVVLLITGYSMSTEEVYLGLSAGAVDYLFKPLDLHITNAKINSLIKVIDYQRDIAQKNNELERLHDDLYRAVQDAERSKVVKENFLANMSHEIRTPLNAIVGITNLLKSSPLDDHQQHMVQLMDFSSNALLGIVDDILESFQIDAGKTKINPVDVDIIGLFNAIGEIMQPLALRKGLIIDWKVTGNVPAKIKADALRLKQILMNLVSNAIKFTPHGKIELGLKVLSLTNSQVQLEFEIKDSGLGIPEEGISKIFGRFEQIHDKTWQNFGGTGLGLSIVKRLVELMGGTVNVRSTLGVGTTFSFTSSFDIAKERLVPHQTSHSITPSSLASFDNVSLLLVEDNEINRFVAVSMLQKWKVDVEVAINGLEAFEKIASNEYDLVLMDTHMPVLNGYEATKKIRNELPEGKNNIPIISFSASVIDHERQEALDAGVDDFLEKPFSPQKLHEKLVQFLEDK